MRIYSVIFIVLFGLIPFHLIAKDGTTELDSLVRIDELDFSSDFEKQMFSSLFFDNENAFELLMTINSTATPKSVAMDKNMLNNELNLLRQIAIPKKKKAKYIKEIYNRVHDRFLKKYELENYFSSIFSEGDYNCVSACLLYSIVFEELGIPYDIKETPTHVYLIVNYPGEEILIETTDPVGGFSKFSQSFQNSFVKNLADSKLIGEQEFINKTTEAIFEEYYFTKGALSLKELVALQYSNDGLFQIDESNFYKSISAFQKSYMLYPTERAKSQILYALASQMQLEEHTDLKGTKILAILSRYDEVDVKNNELRNGFIGITQAMLTNRGDYVLYDSAHNYLVKNIPRQDFKVEMNYIYNYERGRILYNRANYTEALPFLEEAFAIKPNNADIEPLFLSCLGMTLQGNRNNEEILNRLRYLMNKFESLAKNNKFGGLFLNAHLIEMANMYESNRTSAGEYHKEEFEKIANEKPMYQFEESLVGRAYSQLAVYHFRRGHYKSARSAINRGLEFAPNSYELNNRKKVMSY